MRLSKVGVVFRELSLSGSRWRDVGKVPINVINPRRVKSDSCAKVRTEKDVVLFIPSAFMTFRAGERADLASRTGLRTS